MGAVVRRASLVCLLLHVTRSVQGCGTSCGDDNNPPSRPPPSLPPSSPAPLAPLPPFSPGMYIATIDELRRGLMAAGPKGRTLLLAEGETFELDSQLQVPAGATITIQGANATIRRSSSADCHRILMIGRAAKVVLEDLTLADGCIAPEARVHGDETDEARCKPEATGREWKCAHGGAVRLHHGGESDLTTLIMRRVTITGTHTSTADKPSLIYGGVIYANALSDVSLFDVVIDNSTIHAALDMGVGAWGNDPTIYAVPIVHGGVLYSRHLASIHDSTITNAAVTLSNPAYGACPWAGYGNARLDGACPGLSNPPHCPEGTCTHPTCSDSGESCLSATAHIHGACLYRASHGSSPTTLRMSNTVVSGCTAFGPADGQFHGGGLYMSGGNAFLYEGVRFEDNSAKNGDSIYVDQASLHYALPEQPMAGFTGHWIPGRECVVYRVRDSGTCPAGSACDRAFPMCAKMGGVGCQDPDDCDDETREAAAKVLWAEFPGIFDGFSDGADDCRHIAGSEEKCTICRNLQEMPKQMCDFQAFPGLIGRYFDRLLPGTVITGDYPYKCDAGLLGSNQTDGQTSILCGGKTPAGTYQPYVRGSTSIPCPPGNYCPDGASQPLPCAAGTYSPDERLSSATECLRAQPGTYAIPGSARQTACPKGSYSDASGAPSCQLCPAGKYQSGAGGTACTTCGWYSYCPVGTATPIPCGPVSYQPTTGATAETDCQPCPAGHWCTAGRQIPCVPNTYLPGLSRADFTEIITNGNVHLDRRQTCTPCPANTTTDGAEGRASVWDCVCKATYFATNAFDPDSTEGFHCRPCPVGTSCTAAGTTLAALPIRAGYFRLNEGSDDVRRCPDAAANCSYAPECPESTSACRGTLAPTADNSSVLESPEPEPEPEPALRVAPEPEPASPPDAAAAARRRASTSSPAPAGRAAASPCHAGLQGVFCSQCAPAADGATLYFRAASDDHVASCEPEPHTHDAPVPLPSVLSAPRTRCTVRATTGASPARTWWRRWWARSSGLPWARSCSRGWRCGRTRGTCPRRARRSWPRRGRASTCRTSSRSSSPST